MRAASFLLGVAPDFARTETARTFPGSSRNDRLTISGATPEMAGRLLHPGAPVSRYGLFESFETGGAYSGWNRRHACKIRRPGGFRAHRNHTNLSRLQSEWPPHDFGRDARNSGLEARSTPALQFHGTDYSRALKLTARIPGGTGVTPVKSGVTPDFARTKTARTFPGSSRNGRLTISGATPEMTGWKPAPPQRSSFTVRIIREL
jgi:hypothetical protein